MHHLNRNGSLAFLLLAGSLSGAACGHDDADGRTPNAAGAVAGAAQGGRGGTSGPSTGGGTKGRSSGGVGGAGASGGGRAGPGGGRAGSGGHAGSGGGAGGHAATGGSSGASVGASGGTLGHAGEADDAGDGGEPGASGGGEGGAAGAGGARGDDPRELVYVSRLIGGVASLELDRSTGALRELESSPADPGHFLYALAVDVLSEIRVSFEKFADWRAANFSDGGAHVLRPFRARRRPPAGRARCFRGSCSLCRIVICSSKTLTVVLAPLGHFIDRVGDQAVRLSVHLDGCFGIRCFHQADDRAGLLVEPVVEIAHVVLFLNR